MKKITRIYIISNSATDIVNKIQYKEFDAFFDLQVGDKIAYNTKVHVYNEMYMICGIEGIVKDITNFLSTDYHVKSINIEVDDNLLKDIKNTRDKRRENYETNDLSVVECKNSTSSTKNDNEISFE